MAQYRISELGNKLGLTADTLRYYEKINLLTKINRTTSGNRIYTDKDASRLKFIKRAQKMNFTLAEIKSLLKMREDPQHARKKVRELTRCKLKETEHYLKELTNLRNELTLLLNLCANSKDGNCPIIDGIDTSK